MIKSGLLIHCCNRNDWWEGLGLVITERMVVQLIFPLLTYVSTQLSNGSLDEDNFGRSTSSILQCKSNSISWQKYFPKTSQPKHLQVATHRFKVFTIVGQIGQARWASTNTIRKSTTLARHGHDTIIVPVLARGAVYIVPGPQVRAAALARARHD